MKTSKRTSQHRRSVACIVAALTAAACADDARTTATREAPDAGATDRFAGLAARIEQERIELGVPGMAYAVLQGDDVAFARGFGRKWRFELPPDAAPDGAVLPTTLFRIGSVTKMLTATAALQLVEQGKADLDTPVVRYVPDLNLGSNDPAWVSSITLRHLLSHTSGISNALGDASVGHDLRWYWTSGEAGSAAGLKRLAPAGRIFNYSNSGFSLAGFVIERLSGMAYVNYMREKVFAPLGMTRTFFAPEQVRADGDFAYTQCEVPNGVTCSTGFPKGPLGPDPFAPEATFSYPAGYAWSSVLDLARFARFVLNGNDAVLGSGLRAALTTEQADPLLGIDLVDNGPGGILEDHGRAVAVRNRYGFGFVVEDGTFLRRPGSYHRVVTWSHEGVVGGFQSAVIMVPSSRTAFISLASVDGRDFAASHDYALEHFAGLPAAEPAPHPAIDRSTFSTYQGKYVDRLSPRWPLTVTEDSGRLLMTSADPGRKVQPELFPVSANVFLSNDQELITFVPGPDGAVELLILGWGGSVAVPLRDTPPRRPADAGAP
jgi:CubicO group peptidase (beta-lactamase class C family)